ncbi:RraA family protein [Tessaracoccus sp. HDW20]|uniref:RraA family protein n=1 Tax=Tessaracoccus coleopterorum TaxID=2714950 RepID=UPI0018D3E3C8|nr:RraA family protein [Tessaracoccus coleopterorum]NHB85994.1 RraA family protein [Tessaracoccus coleopterorum]
MFNVDSQVRNLDLDFIRAELSAAILSDCLDERGLRNQCLASGINPLVPGTSVVGYAFTVESQRVPGVPETPFLGLLSALDSIGRDEVFVTPTRRAVDMAVWGELVSTACKQRGAAGALTDGKIRDTPAVRRLNFPVASTGTVPYDSLGRHEIVAQQVEIEIDGVTIRPGDLIVADDDGVVIVPSEIAADIVREAAEKRAAEKEFRAAVAEGMGATEAFTTFGVL